MSRVDDQATIREDTEPITRRFPSIGQISGVHWLGGTDDGRAPGPSTYTIEAVITLAPGTTDRLAAEYPLQPVGAPAVPDPLVTFLPVSASWSAAEDLDRVVSRESLWNTNVVVDVGSGLAYLSGKGRR